MIHVLSLSYFILLSLYPWGRENIIVNAVYCTCKLSHAGCNFTRSWLLDRSCESVYQLRLVMHSCIWKCTIQGLNQPECILCMYSGKLNEAAKCCKVFDRQELFKDSYPWQRCAVRVAEVCLYLVIESCTELPAILSALCTWSSPKRCVVVTPGAI